MSYDEIDRREAMADDWQQLVLAEIWQSDLYQGLRDRQERLECLIDQVVPTGESACLARYQARLQDVLCALQDLTDPDGDYYAEVEAELAERLDEWGDR